MIKPRELEVHTYSPPPEGSPGDGGTAVQQSVESVIKPQELEVHTYSPPPIGEPGDGGTAVKQSEGERDKTTQT